MIIGLRSPSMALRIGNLSLGFVDGINLRRLLRIIDLASSM
jgi:hypothetical protein